MGKPPTCIIVGFAGGTPALLLVGQTYCSHLLFPRRWRNLFFKINETKRKD